MSKPPIKTEECKHNYGYRITSDGKNYCDTCNVELKHTGYAPTSMGVPEKEICNNYKCTCACHNDPIFGRKYPIDSTPSTSVPLTEEKESDWRDQMKEVTLTADYKYAIEIVENLLQKEREEYKKRLDKNLEKRICEIIGHKYSLFSVVTRKCKRCGEIEEGTLI